MRKTKVKVRILSWILSFLMAFTAVPVYATENVSGNEEYELKVLTFEDSDYKGNGNFVGKNDWTSLIDTDNQYSGLLLYGSSMGYASEEEAYKWYDEGNTELQHTLPYNYYAYCYMGGGHAISNYVSGDYETYGDYTNQLTVYKDGVSEIGKSGGGYNGSDNFAVHYGYMDGSSYNGIEELSSLSFGDGVAHVIDHMYVNNTIYALNCFLSGNEFTQPLSESDNVKVIATGYREDGTTSQTEIYLADGPENVIMEWTKWDLSCLGKVTKVEFNVLGTNDNGYGFSQPGYFAYDNVAVRFEKKVEDVTPPVCDHSWDDATCTTPKTCSKCGITDGIANPEAHHYVSGVCEYCQQAEPVALSVFANGEVVTLTDNLFGYGYIYAIIPAGSSLTMKYADAKESITLLNFNMLNAVPYTSDTAGEFTIAAADLKANYSTMNSGYLEGRFGLTLSNADSKYVILDVKDGTINNGYNYAFIIEVLPCIHEWTDANCSAPKTCALCGVTEGEKVADAHSYVSGVCEHCGKAEPIAIPFTVTADGNAVEIVDLGESESCSMMGSAHNLSVTVPAGTKALTISNFNMLVFEDHNFSNMLYPPTATLQMADGHTLLCITAGSGCYHLNINEAECDHNFVDGECEHCGTPEIEPTLIVNNGSIEWPNRGCNINKVAVNNVKVDNFTVNGSNYYVTLDSEVAADAVVELGIGTNLQYSNLWVLIDGVCIADSPISTSTELSHSVQLVDGAATVVIGGCPGYNTGNYIQQYAVNKTFHFSTSGKFPVAPMLAGGSSTAALRAQDDTWSIDLTALFNNVSDSAMTYQVAIDGGEAVACDAAYTYTCDTPGTRKLVFTAVNSYGTSPTYTATLTVLPKEAIQTVNYEVDGGTITWFAFTDDKLNPLPEGTTYSWNEENVTFSIVQPVDINLTGKVMTFYNMVKDDPSAKLPLLTGSTLTAGAGTYWDAGVRNQQTNTLSNGTVDASVYLYETAPIGGKNNYTTIKFAYNRLRPDTYFEYTVDGNATLTIAGDKGGVNGHYWTGDREVHIALNRETPVDGIISCVEKSKSVTLADSAGQFSYVTGSWPYEKTWYVKYKIDELPALAEGVAASANVTIPCLETYTLDLAPLFADADEADTMTYQVKLNDGEWENLEGSTFNYVPQAAQDYVFTFRVYDGFIYSEDTYTVNMTAENADSVYSVTVKNAPADIEFYCNAGFGEDGTDLTGVAVETVQNPDGTVTLKVPANVSRISWRAEGIGMSAEVSEGAELTLIEADFTVMAGEEEDTDAVVAVKYGDYTAVGSDNKFLLLQEKDYTYSVTAANPTYRNSTLENQNPVAGENVIDLVIKHLTITAPVDSVVSAGSLSGSYSYYFAEPLGVETIDNIVVYKFAPVSVGYNPFIRVQRPDDPDAVTYWNYDVSLSDGKEFTITEDILFMNDDGEYNADTVYRNFEKYFLDLADIYMNINAKGYIDLNVGGTKQLNMFRNWQAIEGISNAKIAQPDFSYEIITLDGSDVISIEADDNNSGVATLTAKNEGTAIVLVTYDAMYSTLTCSGAAGGNGGARQFSAIWPERTGVFVVSVGKDGSTIETNMLCNGKAFDAEHSPQFYTGTAGASVSFQPESGCTVTVNRGVVGEETLSFGEFTTDGVTVAEDGTVTVSGLTTGRHIIRVEKDGLYTYQVVTAQQVTVEIKDAEGNPVTENTVLDAGETVTVTVTGLTSPAEKLATAYNFNWQITYLDEEGNAYKNSAGTSYGRYDFSSTPQVLNVTIPADWSSDTLTLNGYINAGGYGNKSIGGHREMTYVGSGMANGEPPAGTNLGTLPKITLNVKPIPIPATCVMLDKETAELRVTEKVTLTANLTPANTTEKAVWTSSDEAVATVANGVVTAKAEGTVTITVRVGTYSAQCVVTVLAPIKVTQVILNQTTAKLEIGKLLYLSATVTPDDATDKTVIWTSSKEEVAAVDANGVVTAKAEGTAVITAKAGEVTAACTVTVENIEDNDNTATVYLSISHDAQFVKTAASGKVMAMQKVDVPYFDLSLYGLDAYKIPETNADYGKVTAMHLYIYATEVFYCGIDAAEAGKGYLYTEGILGTDVLTITGSAGSSYMNKFWGYDENLNYYLNYQYPTYAGTSIGATADRIILSDGDIVTVGHFENWAFYDDPASVFNYITVDGGSATVGQNETVTLQVYRAGADMGNGGSNTPVKVQLDVYYAKAGTLTSGDVTAWTKLGTTDADGKLMLTLSDFELGEYIVAVAGRYGEVNTREICSAPGGILLTVAEASGSDTPDNPDNPDSPNTPDNPDNPNVPDNPSGSADIDKIFESTGDYLEKLAQEYGLTVNSIGGEWAVIGLERGGKGVSNVDAYYQEVVKFVRENINDKEQLHRAKSTDNSRVILALTALGYDVTNVGGHNLLVGLTDMDYVKTQGINGPIWALIAFDSHDYEIPAGGDVTREALIQVILDKQLEDNGWALSGIKADPDMTGMALQALAPYYNTNDAVKTAVDQALICLSEIQHEDGGYGSVDGACAESAAQVIVALTALGINPHTDERFVKNDRSVVDALCDYYVEGGGFKHVAFLEVNGMATEQGYYALASYMRFLEGKTALYDMSDVTINTGDNTGDGSGDNTEDSTGGDTEDGTGDSADNSTGDNTGDSTGGSTADNTGGNGGGTKDNTSSGDKETLATEEVDLTPTAESAKELLEALNSESKPEEILDAILAYEELSKGEKEDIQSDERVEELRAQLAEMLQTDSVTGIAVSGTEWNIQIVVEDTFDEKEIQTMKEKLDGHTMLGLWDIYLEDAKTGKEVQPEGSVQIKIPLALLGDCSAFDGLAVVHYADDGTMEYLSSTMDEKYIVFNTVEFSHYAVVGYMGASPLDNLADDALSGNVDTTGTPWLPWVIGGGCGLVLLAALLFIVMKNKKVQA